MITELLLATILSTSFSVRTANDVDKPFNYGYDALQNDYVDLYDIGIIDPAKVTRSTLQNAASIASMVLTTECIIVDKPMEENLV